MKNITLLLITFILSSCTSIKVFSDYDRNIDFSNYETFAYFKPEIDKVDISDLDKRRILMALDSEMNLKGLSKSETPDLLIGFTTKAKEQIYVNTGNNFSWGWGWGFNPWFWGNGGYNSVTTRTEGTLYVNIIDAATKQLIWQGKGRGGINEFMKNRDERISLFVHEIVENYPPVVE
ncbi:MAG: DUF4136 domain-containing protein [Flavobacteriaceae bacterium]|nr:DUF4136 domain-containing protein [Flavobacteriaceae bacterium]MDG1685937.1 DUF4136 domain-containing protein [Flavobacteriaceae bacterium]